MDTATLLDAARAARRGAYAPYSGFDAGAAVLMSDGAVVTGALVENIIFGLSMCAERVALYAAVASGRAVPVAMALSAPSTGTATTYPCGSCLQVALELGGPELTVVVDDDDRGISRSLGELAPEMPVGQTLAQRRGDG